MTIINNNNQQQFIFPCAYCGNVATELCFFIKSYTLNTNNFGLEADCNIIPLCKEHVSNVFISSVYRCPLINKKLPKDEKERDITVE